MGSKKTHQCGRRCVLHRPRCGLLFVADPPLRDERWNRPPESGVFLKACEPLRRIQVNCHPPASRSVFHAPQRFSRRRSPSWEPGPDGGQWGPQPGSLSQKLYGHGGLNHIPRGFSKNLAWDSVRLSNGLVGIYAYGRDVRVVLQDQVARFVGARNICIL